MFYRISINLPKPESGRSIVKIFTGGLTAYQLNAFRIIVKMKFPKHRCLISIFFMNCGKVTCVLSNGSRLSTLPFRWLCFPARITAIDDQLLINVLKSFGLNDILLFLMDSCYHESTNNVLFFLTFLTIYRGFN